MKILAIRGRNLASLGADFAIDFTQEPLASSGLFAIAGPTGAGKSTLLDALCLALYDCTPRLVRAGGRGVNLPDVRDETVSAQDPRNLLRRGTPEGYAEVDFVGNDGLPYRARWTVRRARGRADGKLQASEMRLQRLTDRQAIGGTKTEVLTALEARLGLSFEQFTRAVLLAQNEFATFLKADDNERAELLETLTGTDTFTGISRRAFERCKQEQDALTQLKSQQADHQPLNPPARAELESARASVEQVLAGLEQSRADAEAGLRWHAEMERVREAERLAEITARQASAALQEATGRSEQLQAVEAVQEARPLLSECDRAARELADSEATLIGAEQAVGVAQTAQSEAAARLNAAREALRTANSQRTANKAALDRARSLDAGLVLLAQRRTEAERACAAAEQDERRASDALSAKQAACTAASSAYATTVEWLKANADSEVLAVDWPRWHTLLEQAEKLRAECQAAELELGRQRRRLDEAHRTHAATVEHLASAQRHSGEAERSFAWAASALSQFDAQALSRTKKEVESQRDLHIRGEQLWRDVFDATQRVRQLDRNTITLQATLQDSNSRLSELEAQIPTARTALEQAERSLRAAELACADSVAELRRGLEPKTPCPVCGSTVHPWATRQPPLDAMLESLHTETARCREALLALRAEAVSQKTVQRSAHAQLGELDRQRPSVEAALEMACARWQDWPLAETVATVDDVDRPAWFATRREAIQQRLNELEVQEQAWRSAMAERDAARTRVEGTRAKLHAAEQQEATAAAAVERTELGMQSAQAGLLGLTRKLDTLLCDLDAPLAGSSGWRQAWSSDPDAFHRNCRERAEHYRQQQARVSELRNHSERLVVELTALRDASEKAQADLSARRGDYQRWDVQWQTATQQRQGLLDGRTVAEVETELQAAVDRASADLEQSATLTQQADQALVHALAMRDAATHRHSAAVQAAENADATLTTWFFTCHTSFPTLAELDLEQLRGLLRHDAAWITIERAALADLDVAARRELTVLAERRAARAAIERQRPTDHAGPSLQARLTATSDALAVQRKRLAELDVRLLRDDERRRKCEELTTAVADKEVDVRTWAQLSELIGSADGKKFRNFAQQLTLDVLLAYANRHLSDLSRRYRLERVKDTLGLMVVDQDMGDEVRSVHSLSGGETFLVSLGLALGLASLSSNRVRVESLFVDEGFGSLDAETLATAMDALDSLQAQGRKVGVISHVREMTERISTQIQVKPLSGGQSRIEVIG